ncbi:MAG: c-type cytochrome [OCS116 cluster bacterium]|nr:c-type cytochrome [OCS116 cluster bacterium]
MKNNAVKYLVILIVIIGVGKFVWDFAMPQNNMMSRGMMANQTQNANKLVSAADLSAFEAAGKELFDASCAGCHGDNAAGVEGAGPTFISKIYEPSHHADIAFYRAAKMGVRAHHWPYGNMPAQPQVNEADIEKIVAYIRRLQKENGIF